MFCNCCVISLRHKWGKGGGVCHLLVVSRTADGTIKRNQSGIMININRFAVLSTFVKFGKQSVACSLRNAGKETTQLRQRRFLKTHSRNLAYAKDLFLGQVNKVSER